MHFNFITFQASVNEIRRSRAAVGKGWIALVLFNPLWVYDCYTGLSLIARVTKGAQVEEPEFPVAVMKLVGFPVDTGGEKVY